MLYILVVPAIVRRSEDRRLRENADFIVDSKVAVYGIVGPVVVCVGLIIRSSIVPQLGLGVENHILTDTASKMPKP